MARIYIIDDHQMFRDGLRGLLEAAGHAVVGETDQIAVANAELRKLQPDVVLLDIILGDRSGIELLENVRRRALNCKVIVVTMSGQIRHLADALRWGVDGYLLKGARASDLLEAVTRVMQGARHFSEGAQNLLSAAIAMPSDGDALQALSLREQQVISLVVRGKTSREIGVALHLSRKTVETYRSRIMAKLGTPDLVSLLRFALRNRIIEWSEL